MGALETLARTIPGTSTPAPPITQRPTVQSIQARSEPIKPLSFLGNLATTIARAPFRAGAKLGADISGQPYIPTEQTGRVGKFLLGEQPIESLTAQAGRYAGGLEQKGIPPQVAGLAGGFGATFLTSLDLSVWGGSRKALGESLLKTKVPEEALLILGKAGVPEDIARTYAPKFAQTTDRKVVEQGLNSLENTLKTTKAPQSNLGRLASTRPEPSPIAPESPVGRVLPQAKIALQPLAQEARKYKSAEEFINSLGVGGKNREYGVGSGFHIVDGGRKSISESSELIEVYRGVPKGGKSELVDGDYVSKNFNVARTYGEKVQKVKVPQNTLYKAEGKENFVYYTGKTKSQLTDFYNQATKGVEAPIKPNLDRVITQGIEPTTHRFTGIPKTWDLLKKTFAPATRGEEAQKTASILRESLGKMARAKETTYQSLLQSRKIFDTYTPEQSIKFIDDLEHGRPIQGAEKFTQTMREALDSRWRQIQGIKGTAAYIENYFPHIWEDPISARGVMAQFFGKRPFEGSKSYLKQRTIPTIKQGIDLGLKPVSYNPVDLVMTRAADMDRFLMAHRAWNEFKGQGLRRFVRFGSKPPEGWRMVDDKISRSFQFSPEEKGMILRGNWYMPEKAATIINNYLSPGVRGNPIYDSFRMVGNNLNQVQLGFSAFHALFTSGDAVVSKGALAIQKIFSRGTSLGERVVSVAKLLSAPATAPKILWDNITRGNKLLTDYFRQNPQVPNLVDALERAGGRVRMDTFYLNNSTESFLKALRGRSYVSAFVKTPGAIIETISKPLMQWLVPRQKLGVFADGATHILEQAGKEGWSEYKTTLRLQEMWDSVDNRLGQMVYDNLFWNKTLKDLSMASVRSVGWNLGDIREIPGGVIGLGKTPIQALTKTGRENIRMTPKMAYVISLPYVVGMWGAIIHYLYTGKGPDTLLDYYYPKTGKQNKDGTDERITLPSYMKDVFAYKIEALKTISNKLHPEASTMINMFKNRDYFGTEIRNPNDPLVKQMEDLATYQAKQFVPFSVSNLIRRQQAGGSWGSYLQSFLGVNPAPGYITRSPLETEIYDTYDKRFGGGLKTEAETSLIKQKAQIRSLYWLGKDDEANQMLEGLTRSGAIKDANKFIAEADFPNDVKLFRQLPSQDQEALVKKMELYQLNRYAWYVHDDVKEKFSSISDNSKNFVEIYKKGEVQEPTWKRGKIAE